MKPLKILLITTVITICFQSAYPQQDNTLYFMRSIPQANLPNPASGCDCKINVWGLAVPVLGQVPPPISLNIGHTGFSLKKTFKHGDIMYLSPDTNSSIPRQTVDLRDSLTPDFEYLLKAMRPVNYLTADLQIHLLGGGFKYEDWYFSIGITEKINFSFGYPKDLIGLIYYGNGGYVDKPANLSGLGLNFTHYREYSAGAQRKISDKLKVGAHLKWLFGKSNVNNRKSDIRLYSSTDQLEMVSKWEINASLPDSVLINYKDGQGKLDSAEFDLNSGEFIVPKYIMNRKNFGLALDIGAIYQLNDKVELSASIIDIGYIRWKSNTYTFTQNGDYTWYGLNFLPYVDTHNNPDDLTQALIDSVYKNFMVTGVNKAYNSYLPTKIYMGGTYKYNDKINFGLLSRTEVYQRSLHPSFTLSVNTNFFKWLTATFSYSMINRYFMNLGLGFGAKAAFMQFYVITDNFFGIRPEGSTGVPMPYSSRNMNLRFGCNMIFGCPRQITKSFL
ncbi:MAG: hypothetical protein HY958_04525 [Bacteroidia bacterium]|nr:hypothetical protein [Bacteroidia bacterium]